MSIKAAARVLEQKRFTYTPVPDEGGSLICELLLCQIFDISGLVKKYSYIVCVLEILPRDRVIAIWDFPDFKNALRKFKEVKKTCRHISPSCS